MILKVLIILVMIGFWLGTQKLLGRRGAKSLEKSEEVIQDWVLKTTSSLHYKILQNVRLSNGLLISSSLIIDMVGIFMIMQALFGPSLRPVIAMILVFTLRQINQAITILPPPKGMIWHDPGFPSLFVTYGVSNDLFFSGHSALAVLGAIEIMNLGGPIFSVLAGAVLIFEIAVVLLLRAHWAMDVFTGIVTALLCAQLAADWAPGIDRLIN